MKHQSNIEPWKFVILAELAFIKGGYAFKSNEMKTTRQPYQVVKMSNLYGGKLDLNRNPSFLPNVTEKHIEYSLKPNDIIISLTGTIGKRDFGFSDMIPDQSGLLLNQRLCVIRAKRNISQWFLAHALKSDYFLYHFFQEGKGGTGNQANVGINDLRLLKIPLPPLPEQRKIAEILSTWDKAIETLEKLIEQKEKLKKGLMQQLLTGKKRLPGFEGEWEEVSLGQVTDRVITRNSVGCDNIVTISAKQGFVRQEDFFNKRVASKNTENYYLLKNGEFAYNKSYSKGYPMGVIKRQDRYDTAVVTTLYQCFKINESHLDSDYAVHFFNSGILNKSLTRITQEGARAHGLLNISVSDFYDLSFALPTKLEQIAIGKVLSIAEQELDSLTEKKRLIVSQKKGLMQQLLTGKTRVKA
jgi:type I restriction enzyme S subunit